MKTTQPPVKQGQSKHFPDEGKNPSDRMPFIRQMEWLCALGLTVVLVFFHIYRATQAGALWQDEVNAVDLATLPSMTAVWTSLPYGTPPLLPYVVVRMWTQISWLGSSDASLRALGVVEGLGLLLVFWLSKRLVQYEIPIVSLVLFGMSANVIQWGDSFRGYGLGTFLILLAYGLIWKVVESPTPGHIALAVVVSILSVQSLFVNAALLFAICLGGAVSCLRGRKWKRIAVVLGIGAVSALSLLPYLKIIAAFRDLNVIAESRDSFAQILLEVARVVSSGSTLSLLVWLAAGVIAIISAINLIFPRRKEEHRDETREVAIFSVSVMLLGTLSFLLFSKIAALSVYPWHCIPLMGLAALSASVLIGQIATTPPGRAISLVLVLLAAGAMIPTTWARLSTRQTNVDVIASVLTQRAGRGDLIVVFPWFFSTAFQRYYEGEARWTPAPPIRDSRPRRQDFLREMMVADNAMQPVFDAVEESLKRGNRVWVVGYLYFPLDAQLPATVPPAPHGPGGWDIRYYWNAWAVALRNFLDSHTLRSEEVELPATQPISIYENASVLVFEGWNP